MNNLNLFPFQHSFSPQRAFILLLCLFSLALTDDSSSTSSSSWGKISVSVDSIEPEGGPITGDTRVLVRGGPFNDMQPTYPSPKCKFGKMDNVVSATYVLCTSSPTATEQTEARHKDKTKVYAIKPRYGPKDGETFVEVWGDNFLNFDENTRCNFGSKSVVAHFVSSTYMTCIAPFSDVVEKAIPFSISLNKQQNSRDSIDYWYYNWPAITELVPNFGPDMGGNSVLLKGRNYNPFKGLDIDNSNDTFCEFEGLGKVKATVINATKAICVAPQNYILDVTYVEITLNDQQYTDDNVPYYYYRPPQVFDLDPREGPTKGGTPVTVYGSDFQKDKPIVCRFGDNQVNGTFVDSGKIKCISPPSTDNETGPVPLTIGYVGDKFSTSAPLSFLYYETPEIYNATPICGPTYGYTQITIKGKHFLNLGFGKAKCIFNNTIFMNATIMDETLIKCDSPPLQKSLGWNDPAPYYYISLTINGKEHINSTLKFMYYVDPLLKSIVPNKGPLTGGTISNLTGKGYTQEGICNMTVRYGPIQQKIDNQTDTQMNSTSPNATIPDAVVVSLSGNGQQFINDKILHFRDIENTFTYYQGFLIDYFHPLKGPLTGKSKQVIKGLGFNQFKSHNGSTLNEPIYVRFIDQQTEEQVGEIKESQDKTDEQLVWFTPAGQYAGQKVILQISYNKQQWIDVYQVNATYSYTYYNAASVTGIYPSYGPVKNTNNQEVELTGTNFECPENDCSDLYVRFGDPENGILVKGNKTSDGKIRCLVPKYTKPDVLPVEITFNGEDFTNDNNTYGFFDPYVLDVQPRLISPKGTTKVRLYGFGFVNSTAQELKSKFSTADSGNLTCCNTNCVKYSTYINKHTLETETFPQNCVNYKTTGSNIDLDPMTVEASVYGDVFTENNIEIYYYEEPKYEKTELDGSPANVEKPIMIKADFDWTKNDPKKIKESGNLTCRFTSSDKQTVIYTKAKLETNPIGSSGNPTHIKCNSPDDWPAGADAATLDFSINGQDFSGAQTFNFYEALSLLRIAPMSGPVNGSTSVKLFGTGFNQTKDDVHFRWGVLDTQLEKKRYVEDYIYYESEFIAHAMVNGSEVLEAYQKETYNLEKYDEEIKEGHKLRTYPGKSPKPPNWNYTQGGSIYLAVGQHIKLNMTNNSYDENNTGEGFVYNHSMKYYNRTFYNYVPSYVEYYYYEQPIVKKVVPKSGLTRGGTKLEVSGGWFKYMPEYGILPHCKIGNKIVRAEFFSTVRLVCTSPPNDNINQQYPVSVSLNGVDYVDTGYTFHYYEQPLLYTMTPTCGPDSGGTQIYITGAKFSNVSDPDQFKCRFTDIDRPSVPPKYIPAYYENQTTIMCSSPGGWGHGDSVQVQVTFNGEDYSDNNFTFYFYNIVKAFPRSGPSDGSGAPILIQGSGFRNETTIYCSLDNVLYEPLEINGTLVQCPMVQAKSGSDYFGNVEMALVIDGNWHKFTGGFQYYPQIGLDDIYPHTGPSEGKGVVYFYGKNFREDFELADVSCKIGDTIGKATVMNNGQTIKCVADEIELVDEGYSLPATVSLNGYSWVDSNQTFVPYGITGVYPNSGPITGNTDVLITGKGFSDDLAEKGKCKFGVNANYAIVDAEVLSYDKIICRSPQEYSVPSSSDQTVSIPIGIGFQEDELQPYTQGTQRFRFYGQPSFVKCDPEEVEVGKMAEVFVNTDENGDLFEPIPTGKGTQGQYGISCKFGRFGIGQGTYLNRTTIKCLTPSVSDDPDSIWKEQVILSVSMNGQDFNDDSSEIQFAFIGNGSALVFWPYVIACLLIALLLIALIVFCSALLQRVSFENMSKPATRMKQRSYVIRDPYDQFTQRAYSSGMMGRSSVSK